MRLKEVLHALYCGRTLHIHYKVFIRVSHDGARLDIQNPFHPHLDLGNILSCGLLQIFEGSNQLEVPLVATLSDRTAVDVWFINPFSKGTYCDKNHEVILKVVDINKKIT